MNKTWTLWAIFGTSNISSGIDGWAAAVDFKQSFLFTLVPGLLLLILVFQWLSVDSREHNYVRSQALNICIIFFGIVALPYYLYKTRTTGNRLRPILAYCAILAGLMISNFLAANGVYTIVAP